MTEFIATHDPDAKEGLLTGYRADSVELHTTDEDPSVVILVMKLREHVLGVIPLPLDAAIALAGQLTDQVKEMRQ